ncbi:unnamed protein product [Echinostoma caproni]|uniref:XK-related protein n=1 Tax=Echinostoma caproni TaxID=27848 RepID=A0A183AQS7_9TREM|nr:unnamed protein product [Echinostoma caproni]
MLQLEKQYMAEAIAYAKEFKPPSNLPAGSLLSAPMTSIHPTSSHKTTSSAPMDANRLRGLNVGLIKVQKVRRQFRRTERDAAYVALASGVAGAGPFMIAQGVLLFRRIGLNFAMARTTVSGIISCMIFATVWICATLTHFYPVSYEQSEVEHERGIGQVPVGGLILLFTVHMIHVSMRCGALILFTGQFYYIVLAVIAFHFVCVWIMTVIARSCTRTDYSNPSTIGRSSISGNFLSDLMFAYVGLFEFCNAQAKFTRTRYFIYYFLYYLENASMVGAWYVYFTYPEVWYYLPSLLIITIVQLLGFILLQVYLFLYSRPRRKTTLCGLCFAHREMDADTQFPVASVQPNELESNLRAYGLQQHPSKMSGLGVSNSMISGRAGTSAGWNQSNVSGICDPMFGQQISQVAVPSARRVRGKSRQAHVTNSQPQSVNFSTNCLAPSLVSTTNETKERLYKQRSRDTRQSDRYSGIETDRCQRASSTRLDLEAKESPVQYAPNTRTAETNRSHRDGTTDGRSKRNTSQNPHQTGSSRSGSRRTQHTGQNSSIQSKFVDQPDSKGVFQPRADHGRNRPQWPYATNSRR